MSDADVEVVVGADQPGSRPSRRGQVIKAAFGLAVLVYGIVFVAGRWHKVQAALADADPWWIALAVVFAAVGQWPGALGLRAVLIAGSHDLPVLATGKVYFVSQLGKYIPGSVWPIVAVTEMCRKHGVARATAAVSGLLALMFSLVAGSLVGIVLTVVGAAHSVHWLWWLLLVIPACAIGVHPRVLHALVARGLRIARRQPVELHWTKRRLVGALGWPVVGWLLLGLHCWALVVALGGPVAGSFAGAVGGFALAYVAGTLFIPAPAGAGVREGVLGVALGGITAAGFHNAQIIAVVLLSRVLLAMLDFLQAGAVLVAVRVRAVPAAS